MITQSFPAKPTTAERTVKRVVPRLQIRSGSLDGEPLPASTVAWRELKIERNIPIPTTSGRGFPKSPLRLALESMEIGDSVQIPRKQKAIEGIYKLAKEVGVKVATRQVNCEARRIWRVA